MAKTKSQIAADVTRDCPRILWLAGEEVGVGSWSWRVDG